MSKVNDKISSTAKVTVTKCVFQLCWGSVGTIPDIPDYLWHLLLKSHPHLMGAVGLAVLLVLGASLQLLATLLTLG